MELSDFRLIRLTNDFLIPDSFNCNDEDLNDFLINEFGKMAKVLIKKQVPQMYLKHKINKSKSSVEKGLISEIVGLLDRLG